MERINDFSGTIDKALELLFHLHEQPASRGVSELGRKLPSTTSPVSSETTTMCAAHIPS
jgi:DNA-binding IclR family transcriptional regulator